MRAKVETRFMERLCDVARLYGTHQSSVQANIYKTLEILKGMPFTDTFNQTTKNKVSHQEDYSNLYSMGHGPSTPGLKYPSIIPPSISSYLILVTF